MISLLHKQAREFNLHLTLVKQTCGWFKQFLFGAKFVANKQNWLSKHFEFIPFKEMSACDNTVNKCIRVKNSTSVLFLRGKRELSKLKIERKKMFCKWIVKFYKTYQAM